MKLMKKTYLQPQVLLFTVRMASHIALSGNFTEGETITDPVSNETIDGGNAWSRRQRNLWDLEDDDSK